MYRAFGYAHLWISGSAAFAACSAGADIQESPGGLGHLDAQGDPAVPQLYLSKP